MTLPAAAFVDPTQGAPTAPMNATPDRAEYIAKLARMAGQIADFFKAYPDAEAVPAIADHINQFWGRRMREDFLAAYVPAPDGLAPLVRKALPLVKGHSKSPDQPIMRK